MVMQMGWSHQILARADHQPARAAQLHRRVPGLRDQCRRADPQAFREPHKFAGAFRSCRSSARSSERSERCRTYVILRCLLYTSPAKLTLQASSRFDHIYHSAEFVRASASAAITFRPNTESTTDLPNLYQTLHDAPFQISLVIPTRRVRVRVRVRVNESMIERLALALAFWSGPPHL